MQDNRFRLQRNLLIAVCGILLISNMFLAVMLWRKQEFTVLLPTIDSKLVVGSKYVSDEYLKLRADQVIDLLFNIRKETMQYYIQEVLKQCGSKEKQEFEKQLEQLTKDIKQKGYYYVFAEDAYEIDNQNLCVTISGYLETYLDQAQINRVYKSYKLGFVNNSGLVMLTSFEEVV